MTKLQKIRAKCVELLDDGKKDWEATRHRTRIGTIYECEGIQIPSHEVFAITDKRAIAGWLATIAAIDACTSILHYETESKLYIGEICDNDGRGCPACSQTEMLTKAIESAWPDELL